MFFFRAVTYLLMQRRVDLYIAYRGMQEAGKKIPAHATLLLTMKPEVESLFNRNRITHNRKGHRVLFPISVYRP